MDSKDLKQYIYDNQKIEYILENLNMHHIKSHDGNRYITCGFPDGDNIGSCVVYCDNEFLNVEAHTRNIIDKYGKSDIISLVCFMKDTYFSMAIKYICDLLELDYYSEPSNDLPESLKYLKMIEEMNKGNMEVQEKERLKPISLQILNYYKPYVNDLFKKDGINYNTQKKFDIGYDLDTHRITIPIYDEIDNLVGVKGRLFKKTVEKYENKYTYIEPCAKSYILYGLNKTLPFIKEKGICIIGESEKFVMQLWSVGIRNTVSIGGHDISSHQVEKLTRLDCKLIFAYDKDVLKDWYFSEASKFIKAVDIEYLYDTNNILNEKESPSDDIKKFKYLYQNCKYIIK